MIWRPGLVDAVDGGRVKVRLPDEGGLVTGWLPVVVPFALGAKAYWMPRPDSQVAVLLDEHCEAGVCLGAIYSSADPAPMSDPKIIYLETEDGTKISVDPTAKLVTVDTPGSVEAKAGDHINAEAPTITLKGAVTVDGTLTVNEDATLQAGLTVANDAIIGGKPFLPHTHTAQGATSPTTPPN